MKCSKTSWYTAVLTLDLRKHSGPTPADDMAPQTITDCGNFTLDLKQRGFCASPLFLQTLGPWFPNEMPNLLSSEKRTLDHWAMVVLFLLSSGKMLLTMFLFQKWLGSPFTEDVWAWWLNALTPASVHSLWSSPKCLNRLCLTAFSSLRRILFLYYRLLLLVHLFLSNFFLPVNFGFNMLWYSTPWTATPFSNDPLWLTLFVEGVNDRLLDHCHVSFLPHYCGFKEHEIPRMYTVGMVIYWNSNVNIIIFWDTGFLTFIRCKL